jgi:hypothetical protein
MESNRMEGIGIEWDGTEYNQIELNAIGSNGRNGMG